MSRIVWRVRGGTLERDGETMRCSAPRIIVEADPVKGGVHGDASGATRGVGNHVGQDEGAHDG